MQTGVSAFFLALLPTLFACGPEAPLPKATLVPVSQIREALKPRGKPLLVNHWASWCRPCVEELPELADLARRYRGRVDFVGVSWDFLNGSATFEEARAKVDAAVRKGGVPYDSLVPEGSPEALGELLGLESLSIPQTYLFDREGKKVAEFEPIEDEQDVKEVERILNQVQ